MPALPTGIITQLTGGEQPKPKLRQAYLSIFDTRLKDDPPWAATSGKFGAIAFQYWPETVQDSRAVDWNPRSVPGGSHPIYQWSASGERKISFTAVFTNDFEPEEEKGSGGVGGLIDSAVNAVQSAAASIGLAGSPPKPGDKLRQVDVAAAISWLRWFTYPYYEQDDLRVYEPAKALLVMPGSSISFDGEHSIACVMTQCEVTYEAFFPNGAPRIVEVSLEFAEVVQSETGVRFHSRDKMKRSAGVGDYLKPVDDSDAGSGGLLEDIAGAVGGALGL